MQDLNIGIQEALQRIVPPEGDASGDWRRVVREAGRRGKTARRTAIVATAASAVAAGVLLWPSTAPQGTILERALAAVGDGPVLHIIRQDETSQTLVELRTGARQELHGQTEIWYDADRRLVHQLDRLGGVVVSDDVRTLRRPPSDIVALGRRYRKALEDGSARVAGRGVVEGTPVHWITVQRKLLPDVADHRLHEWTQQVAVSDLTFKPIYTRETRDGDPAPFTEQRVLALDLLPAGQGDFTADEARSFAGAAIISGGWEPIELANAERLLGLAPLWLGQVFQGIPLAGLGRSEYAVMPKGAEKWDRTTGVGFFYGKLGPENHPDYASKPFVAIEEVPHLNPAFRGSAGGYVPPPGTALVFEQHAFLKRDGLYVSIDASDGQLALAAAAALVKPSR